MSFCSTILSMKLLFSHLPHCVLMTASWLLELQPQVHIPGKKKSATKRNWCLHQETSAFSNNFSRLLLMSVSRTGHPTYKEDWKMYFYSLLHTLPPWAKSDTGFPNLASTDSQISSHNFPPWLLFFNLIDYNRQCYHSTSTKSPSDPTVCVAPSCDLLLLPTPSTLGSFGWWGSL